MTNQFSDVSTEELQKMLHRKRKELTAIRQYMDEIEAVLLPRLTRESALNKINRAGLTEAELKSLIKDGTT